MSTDEYEQVELTDDQRADAELIVDALRTAGWRVYQETTRTDDAMIMLPGAGARYETATCTLDAEYVALGISIGIEGLGDWEDHELIVHGCGRDASRHNRTQPNDDEEKLRNVLAVLTSYQDRLIVDSYAAFGRDLLKACGFIEYNGDDSGALEDFTQEKLDAEELPLPRTG